MSTEEEREAIRSDFEKSEDWLYEDGMDLTASAYQDKKRELEKSTSQLFLRLSELEARPRVVAQAQDAINWTLTILETWAAERPEVTAEERAKVKEMCTNFTEWLDDVSAKQDALQPYEPLAFLSSQVTTKLEPVEKEVRRLIKKPKPKPKKVRANATNTTNATGANATAGNASDAANATAGVGGAEAGGDPEDLPPHDEL